MQKRLVKTQVFSCAGALAEEFIIPSALERTLGGSRRRTRLCFGNFYACRTLSAYGFRHEARILATKYKIFKVPRCDMQGCVSIAMVVSIDKAHKKIDRSSAAIDIWSTYKRLESSKDYLVVANY